SSSRDWSSDVCSSDLTFSVYNEGLAVMHLFPGKIVVVFHIQQHPGPQRLNNMPVDTRVVGGGVLAHQVHGPPILLAIFRRQIQQLGRASCREGEKSAY